MNTFIISIIALILGYIFYGALVEKIFIIDKNAKTPAYNFQDGVDFIPMKRWRLFLIQFLNIAGLGPIFGAIMGIFYGPSAYLWIVLGSIFGGAVHDYLTGMMSVRQNGISLPEVLGEELGHGAKIVIRLILAIMIVLLILVTTSFLEGVAVLLQDIIPLPLIQIGNNTRPLLWILLIFLYFAIATILPIDKLIGKIYPFLGVILLFMGIGVCWAMFSFHSADIPEIFDGLGNRNTNNLPVFPMMLMSISCGAISGFHGTQSPLMARCVKNEREGRYVFYGAMICEGLLALIWAAAAGTFFTDHQKGIDGITGLQQFAALHQGENIAALVVNKICTSWLGAFGGFLAILGVIFAPITTGDTALRSSRLMIADAFNFDQKKISNRLILTAPLLVIITILLFVNFEPVWRYFSFVNQSIAAISLWGGSVYLYNQEHRKINPTKYKYGYLISLIPAVFMTMTCSSYFLLAPEGLRFIKFGIPTVGYSIAAIITISVLIIFFKKVRQNNAE